MHAGDLDRQALHQWRRQGAARGQPVEKGVLVEAPHLDHRIDERACAVEVQPVALPRDAEHAEIVLRRGAAIQRDLALAEGETLLGRREIGIGKAYGALQLPGAFRADEDVRDMGLDLLHAAPLAHGSREKGADLALIAYLHRRPRL